MTMTSEKLMTMKPTTWGTVPDAGLRLRAALPKISTGTRRRVVEWAMRQPNAVPWLLQRSEAYWDGFHQHPDPDLHGLIDATSALDLLEHVSLAHGGSAVQWMEHVEAMAAKAESWAQRFTGTTAAATETRGAA